MLIQRGRESRPSHQVATSATNYFTIGQLARLTGIATKNIRYYESCGLLPIPQRARNGYRRYTQADVNRLRLLRRLRLLDVPLADLSPLLTGADSARCSEMLCGLLALVARRLVALDQEIAELQHLRAQVQQYQQQLADCHPDEQEPFSTCVDMSCLALKSPVRTRGEMK